MRSGRSGISHGAQMEYSAAMANIAPEKIIATINADELPGKMDWLHQTLGV